MRVFLLIFSLILTVGSVSVLSLLEFWSDRPGSALSEQVFEVRRGENALAVAENLEKAGIVRSRFGFLYALARLKKLDGGMVAGEYRLAPEVSSREIALRITTGQALSRDVRVTFPEGFTALQMANRLTEANLPGETFLSLVRKPKEEWRSEFPFLQSTTLEGGLEGFLFPDTYRFDRQVDAESIVEIMLKTFEKKAWPLLSGQTPSRAYETLVLSSIVETEVRSDRDRSLVAGIFLRRLSIGQPLQSDATVKYVLGLNKIQHSFEETRTDSPYNTYIHKGLPPGPISNPGLSAIAATLNPAQNDMLYFLSDPKTGETVFANTFEEHVRNKAAHGL